jgi:hypothetical protein
LLYEKRTKMSSFTNFVTFNLIIFCCLIIAANAFTVQLDNADLTCYRPGTWENCSSLSVVSSPSHDNCLAICKNTSNPCTHMTYSTGLCQTFAGTCGLQLQVDPGTFQSSQKACPAIATLSCEDNYCCRGKALKVFINIPNALECRTLCATNITNCFWYSYYNSLKTCYLMDSKGTPSDVGTNVCTSGQFGCPLMENITCGLAECCNGKPVEPQGLAADPQECLEKCQKLGLCKWFTHRGEDCFLLDSCPEPFPGSGNCMSGQRQCENATVPITPTDSLWDSGEPTEVPTEAPAVPDKYWLY